MGPDRGRESGFGRTLDPRVRGDGRRGSSGPGESGYDRGATYELERENDQD